MTGSRFYYLHSLLAGRIDDWAAHLDRCQAMRFDAVVIPPPFVSAGSGDLFLVADFARLDPRVGDGEPAGFLARYADEATGRALLPVMDLVLDQVAAGSPAFGELARWYRSADDDEPPDPRRPLWQRGAARLDPVAEIEGAADAWSGMLAAWLDAGIGGFRCVRPERVPPSLWRALIARVRTRRPEAIFIAATAEAESEQPADTAQAGFDMTSLCFREWDYRSPQMPEAAEALTEIAPPMLLPETPFGRRFAAGFTDTAAARLAARRAVAFAASCGAAWLMPMGFEFGASRPLDPARDRPDDFTWLAAAAPFDIEAEIAAANAACGAYPWPRPAQAPRLLSAPRSAAAALLCGAGDANAPSARVVVVNSRLDGTVRVAGSPLLLAAGACGALLDDPQGGGELGPGDAVVLQPGEVRVLGLRPARGIAAEAPDPDPVVAAAAPRIAIEAVAPAVDDGRFPVKRLAGDVVEVSADLISDGHDRLAAALLWRPADEADWREAPMELAANDRWVGRFPLARLGAYRFTVLVWKDRFGSYAEELEKKHAAGLPIALELEEGRLLVADIAERAGSAELMTLAAGLGNGDAETRRRLLLAPATAAAVGAARLRPHAARHPTDFPLLAERRAAGFASWYELFPRSQTADPAHHGTFDDVIARLPAIRAMGFDVLYFPPIHPIGRVNRKGRNNAPTAEPGDPGSPYAIGSAEGGHDAIHPQLGTLADFRRLIAAAAEHGIELALDFAIQCAPDHPWLREHPDWFVWRPDGSMRYAENPPKKYEDIVNVDFYAEAAVPALWLALRDIVMFWAREGVRLFRVDNPHTKPLPFWEWLIAAVRREFPDALFLAEAFTRPKMMYRLAKIGFSQSYTYFTWRNTKAELTEYFTELTQTAPREFFRPHLFVNTPDINPGFLQTSGRAGFLIRAVLAATLSGLFGVYSGFELCEAEPLPGREEYLDSEKYEIRARDWNAPGNIVAELAQLNRIRRANPALQTHLGLQFHNAFDDQVLYYAKATADLQNVVLVAVDLDPRFPRDCDIEVPLWLWGFSDTASIAVDDLMGGGSFVWQGKVQRIRLDPATLPFAVWRIYPMAGGG